MSATNSLQVSREVAPVRSQVLENLRVAIVSQRFRPGERLREKDLCDLTGTSRTSVREALRQLESEGLVTVIANVGPVVTSVTPTGVRDIYQVRAALEGLAGRLFAQYATAEQVERLGAIVARFGSTAAEEQKPSRLDLKEQFYEVLLQGSGNAEVARILSSLRARIAMLRATTLAHPGRFAETVTELDAIMRAITDRDADAAEYACRAHVEAALRTALLATSALTAD